MPLYPRVFLGVSSQPTDKGSCTLNDNPGVEPRAGPGGAIYRKPDIFRSFSPGGTQSLGQEKSAGGMNAGSVSWRANGRYSPADKHLPKT